ncbi:heavy-metal-associated domain-containing protein [Persicimonas caeni]|uniref:Heavy-metal-associated domain-containing protein n=1 Tax=Persicimonas caeni TaxID=2292766 RepID=A0A4Y6PWY6_PERCE|nr:heavy metal-associated domain-containing protein [Persicimonas caeni]QDG52832.1 heavy-metal-associated domain-containing protein [Persicimonas caeni]QED34054.1 heavy-metal-associated domain-containing protein [Persicimonas caeni]
MQDMLELYVPELVSTSDMERIEDAVDEVRGVDSASADLRTQMVWVRYDNDITSARSIAHAIEGLGYTVSQRPSERRPGG